MRAEVGEVLEVVEGEHGPALCALYGEEAARGCGRALERDEPLDRRQQACHFPGESSKFVLLILFLSGGDGNVRTPYAPECTRVPDDAGQLRELRRQRARRFNA